MVIQLVKKTFGLSVFLAKKLSVYIHYSHLSLTLAYGFIFSASWVDSGDSWDSWISTSGFTRPYYRLVRAAAAVFDRYHTHKLLFTGNHLFCSRRYFYP